MSTLEHITPENSAIVLIDHSLGFLMTVGSADTTPIIYGAVALAHTAKLFNMPMVVTNADPKGTGGPLAPQLEAALEGHEVIIRYEGPMDSFDEPKFAAAIKATGRKKLILAGILTEVCAAYTTITAISQGYEVYIVTDACGAISPESHLYGIQRMIQAGAVPISWVAVVAELQRKWGGEAAKTVPGVAGIFGSSSGNWGNLNAFYSALKK